MSEKDWFDYLVGVAQIITAWGVLAAFKQAKVTQKQLEVTQKQLDVTQKQLDVTQAQLKESQTPKVELHIEDLGFDKARFLLINQKNLPLYVTYEAIVYGENGEIHIDQFKFASHPCFRIENEKSVINQGESYSIVIEKPFFTRLLIESKSKVDEGNPLKKLRRIYPKFNLRSTENSKTDDIHMMELRFKVPGIPDNTVYFYLFTDRDAQMIVALKEKISIAQKLHDATESAIYLYLQKEIENIEQIAKTPSQAI